MKKLLPIIFALISFSSYSATINVNIWDYSKTFISGDTVFIDIKFSVIGILKTTDSLDVYQWAYLPVNNGEKYLCYKISILDLELIPKQSNGTRRLKFVCPQPIGTTDQFITKWADGQRIYTPVVTSYFDEVYLKEHESKYYDLNGVECVPIEGLYIKEFNGKREKVFIAPN